MRVAGIDVLPTAKTVFKEFREDDTQGLASEVAYHLLFSVVPLLIFLTALSGFVSRAVGVNDAMGNITPWLFENLPQQTAEAVQEPIESVIANQSGGFLSVGAVLALWGARNAMASLMKALNVAFDVKETRPWWKKQVIAIGLTIALGLGIVGGSAFFLIGSSIGAGLADLVGLGGMFTTVWSVLRWPLIFVLVSLAVAFLYWAGPNVDAPFTWLTPGSVLAVLLWAVATFGLSFYFRYFGGYAEAYGLLGGVLAFVFWLYVMSLILLIGGELNAVLALHHSQETQADLAANPEKQGSDVGAARRDSSGTASAEASEGVPPADPGTGLSPNPAIGAAVPWPSAERLARQRLTREGHEGEQRRAKNAVTALGASVATAVSAVIIRVMRR